MAMSLSLIPAILELLFVFLAQSNALIDRQTPSCCSNQGNQISLACQLEEANLKLTRLESILEERIGNITEKSQYHRECERKIEELTVEIVLLETAVSSFEDDWSSANQKLEALEEEIRLLWAASRKNNFEIHSLEYKAVDAERRLQGVTDQVEEMAEIVSEQWIQIQQLEQATHMAEIRTLKVKRESGWRRCPYVKFFAIFLGDCLDKLKVILDPYAQREGSLFSSAKHYHHQLQIFVKQSMKSYHFTAPLAHEELIFFVASALFAFPIMSACMLLMSQFS